MTDRLPDQDQRDAIGRELGETFFVEAGAGSGKTRALVNRAVALLLSGVEPHELAAITFTEAAAAEMKDRLRLALEEIAAAADHPRRQRAGDLLGTLDAAAVQTIHGFAQRILALHPLEAGLPPRFHVRDEVEASIAFDERWEAILDDLLSDPELRDHVAAVLAIDARVDSLQMFARRLHGDWHQLQDAPPGPPAPLVLDLEGLAGDYRALAARRDECRAEGDKLAAYLEELEAYATNLVAPRAFPEQVRALCGLPAKPGRVGRKADWLDVDSVRAELAAVRERQEVMARGLAGAALEAVMDRIMKHVRDYAEERRRDGVLEFHDLLIRARALLVAEPAVRRDLGSRFRHILLDEFQDTDPLQLDIVRAVANGESRHDASPPPGRLFFVGDPKQSIYRFRGADIALYLRARDELSARVLRLTTNFRSEPSILAWVNHVFGAVIGESEDEARPRYVPLDAARTPSPAQLPAVRLLGRPVEGRAETWRPREAEEIAVALRTAKAEAWPVAGSGAVTRPPRYQDMAVLVRSRASLPALEQAFERYGIPYRVESRALLFNTQEVRDLANILAAIDDPTDQVALVAALRSPAFGCGDDDLLAFATAGGRWDYLAPAPAHLGAGHPVCAAMLYLAGQHETCWRRSPAEVVDAVIRERRLLELAYAHPRPRERWQRYRFLQDQARAFAAEEGSTLRRFVAWLRQQAEEKAMVIESPVPDPDDDAVRLMTIHAAKGLEFPIVFVLGLGTGPARSEAKVLWQRDGRPVFRLRRELQPPEFEEIEEIEKRFEREETSRLVYVATTRARDHLVVSLYCRERKKAEAATPAQQLHHASAAAPGLWRPFEAASGLVAEPPPPTVRLEDSPEQREAYLAGLRDLAAGAAVPASIAATTIARGGLEADTRPEPAEDAPAWRRGRAGRPLGRAVHAVLQEIDLATGAGLDAAAIAQAAAEGIPWRQAEVARLAGFALQSPSVCEAVAGGAYWRELFVGVPFGEQLLEGFIDLLYEQPGGLLVVIDYKTDAVLEPAAIDAAAQQYRLQAAAYGLAIERSLGRPVAACRLVFLTRAGAVEREVEDLREAIGEVEAFLATRRS